MSLLAAAGAFLAAPARAEAGCGMGNQCAVVDAVTTAPGPSGVTVTCAAHDPDGLITKLTFSASAGSFSNGTSAIDVTPALPAQSASASTTWTPVPGASVSCVAWDSGGGFMHIPTQSPPLSVTYNPPANPPVIDACGGDQTSPLVGQTVKLTASAHDPGGQPVTASWSTTGGTLWTNGADPFSTQWTAPSTPGVYQVTLTVRNSAGVSSTSTVVLSVGWATPDLPIFSGDLTPMAPARLATDAAGNLYVGDSRAHAVRVFTPQGLPLRTISLAGRPGAITVGPGGEVWIADLDHGRVDGYDLRGLPVRTLGVGEAELRGPLGLAVDAGNHRIYAADADAQIIKMYDDGSGALVGIALVPDSFASGLAFDGAASELYVADARHGNVRVLSAAGVPRRTIGAFGSGAGQLTRTGSVSVTADGTVYVVDTFQSRVAAFTKAGVFLTFVGSFGSGLGQLQLPVDVAGDAFGRVLVSSAEGSRVDVFRLASARPAVCAGDSDCDGIPDWWEIAHGLDPFDPRDAFLDPDGDGLVNLAEFRAGTDPFKADSDGDGILDGAEVLAGQSPIDPNDNRPFAHAGQDRSTDPTVVTLDGRTSYDPNGDALTYAWEQVSGPTHVDILHADSAEPSVVLRRAGEYVFRVRVHDGRAYSLWSGVAVSVRDLAPTADAGRDLTVKVGSSVALDGRFSSDANGDALAHAWIQVAGPNVDLVGATNARATFQPASPGLYTFELVVADGLQHSQPDRVNVLVTGLADHLPTAAVTGLVEAQVGSVVALDGRACADSDGDTLSFTWAQLEGPAVTLDDPGAAVARFAAAEPGVYRFSLTASDGHHQSLPAFTTVVVDHPQNHVPRARAAAPTRVEVLSRVTLDCAGSSDADGDPVTCAWTQLAGPRAPLELDGQAAIFTPIDPGMYVFELQVGDPEGPGTRETVTVVADDPRGNSVPRAAAAAALASSALRASAASALDHRGAHLVVDLHAPLRLSASSSTDANAGDQLSATWTQVAGPMVALSDPRAASPTFLPPVAGTYAFELCVDDGKARSPAARAEVTVVSRPEAQRSIKGAPTAPPKSPVAPQEGAALGLLTLLLGALRRRRALGAAALAFPALMWASDSQASDAPHDATNLPNGCEDCHTLHSAAGGSLTKASGNANLCMSCHNSTGTAKAVPFSASDQAVPGTSGNSHRFDAAVNNPRYGATAPTDPEMTKRLSSGLMMCSTCHDQHSQAHTPADPVAPGTAGAAGRHFQRIDATSNAMCVNCHSAWNMSSAASGTYASSTASSFTANGTTVTGLVSTAALKAGWQIKRQADSATAYTIIQSVDSATQVTLVQGYKGTTGGGAWDGAKLLSHPVSATLPSADPTFFWPPNDLSDTGTTTSAGTTGTFTDTTKAWVPSSLVGHWVMFTTGLNAGERRQVTANTATSITVNAFVSAIGAGDAYRVEKDQIAMTGTAGAGSSTTLLVDAAATFTGTLGMWVRVTGPIGDASRFQARQITAVNSPTSITVTPAFPATLVGTTYELDWDGNLSNNVYLDNGGTPSVTQGNVVCLSCHSVHFADSNASTYSANAGAGDGHLLRRGNTGEACEICHNLRIHNSANMGSSRAPWGMSFTCRTCHQPHQTSNIRLVSQAISTPNSGVRGVDLRADTGGQEAYGLVTGSGAGVCEVCHTDTRNGAPYATGTVNVTSGSTTVTCATTCTWSGNVAAGWEIQLGGVWYKITAATNTTLTLASAYTGATLSGATYSAANPRFRNDGSGRGAAGTEHYITNCTACHQHATGFAAGESEGGVGCDSCHGTLWDRMRETTTATTTIAGATIVSRHRISTAAATSGDFADDFAVTWADPLQTSVPAANRSCVNMCHGDHDHTTDTDSTHASNAYEDATSYASRGTNTGSTSQVKTGATRASTDFDNTATNGGMCLSCHRFSVDTSHPAISKAGYNASAHNAVSTSPGGGWGYNQHSPPGGTFQRNCTKCHGERADARPVDGSIPFEAVHYSQYPDLLSGAKNAALVQGTANAAQTGVFLCYNCHGDATAGADYSGKNIRAQVAKAENASPASGHPVNKDATHNELAEYTNGTFGAGLGAGVARHVSCTDCHDEHLAQAGGHTNTTGTAVFSANSTAVVGVGTTWSTFYVGGRIKNNTNNVWYTVASVTDSTHLTLSAVSAAAGTGAFTLQVVNNMASPTLEGAWGAKLSTNPAFFTAPTTTNFTKVTLTASKSPAAGQDNLEASLCFKCHSAYSWGTGTPGLATSDTYSTGTAAVATSGVVTGTGTTFAAAMRGRWFKSNSDGVLRQITAYTSATSITVSPAPAAAIAAGAYTIQIGETDTSVDFNPANAGNWKTSGTANSFSGGETAGSFHPVLAECNDNLGAVNLANLTTTNFPWRTTAPTTGTTSTFTAGSTAVTVNSTTNLLPGMRIRRTADGIGAFTTIATVVNTTTLTLATGYAGTTGTGAWEIGRNRMTCSDCHGSDTVTDPMGPHGSAAKFVLSGPNTTWNATITMASGGTTSFCANCHSIGATNSRFSGGSETHASSKHSGIPCWNCHSAIPHGTMRPGLLSAGNGGCNGASLPSANCGTSAMNINAGGTVVACQNGAGTQVTCLATDNPPYNQSASGTRLHLLQYPTSQTGNWTSTSYCGCGATTSH